ncbi:MAG: Crp/Fnr family transcriptional regulator [Desulfobacterales bacterium]|nr:Crp/Fnr family transcriptional regulator [Desulfobacterales bacterium]
MSLCGKSFQSCRLCQSFESGIFSDLPEKDLKLLEQCKTANHYKRKQVIFYEGNPVVGLYCIQSGKVKLYKTSGGGKQQILKIAQEGDILGHSALFTETPHMATAEVMEEANICFLDKTRFILVLQTNPSVSLKLLGQLSRELNRAEEQVLDLAYKSVRVRLVEFLLTLKQNFGVYEQGVYRLQISLSREELAQAIGTTVETVVRLLTEFRTEGLIEVEKKSIAIREPEKLLEFIEAPY